MSEYASLLRRLMTGDDLSEAEAAAFVGEVFDGSCSPVRAAGVLVALAIKGERTAEIAGAARAMRARATRVEHDLPQVLDVVGTGGDGARTINISTMAAIVCASAGVPVAKHGNRAASGSCGSADVLEAVGFPIDLDPDVAAAMLRECGFTFLFAPRYHPAMRQVAPVRRELGIRSIFNVLGPLTNPAGATDCIVGTSRGDQLEVLGDVLRALGVRRGAVVHSANGLDEVAGDALTDVYSFDPESVRRWTLDPRDFAIARDGFDVSGPSVEASRAAFEAVLAGERSGRSDTVALNAALALTVAGVEPSLSAAYERARALLASGAPWRTFERAREFARV